MNLQDLVGRLRWRGKVPEPDSVQAWFYASAVLAAGGLAFPLLSHATGQALPPFITFYPAVVIAALAGGPRIGIAAAAASLAVAWWFFMDDRISATAAAPAAIYLASSIFLGWTVGQARLALDRAVAAEQARANTARESVHRIKNLLAVVQALTRKVHREAATTDQFRAIMNSRLAALGSAQDILLQRDWKDLPLAQLVTSSLAPFLPNPGLMVRPGPATLVPARHATGLSMALFELATNAMKYGALSEGRGPVVLSWRHDDAHAVLAWDEETHSKPGEADGFGMKLIQAALDGDPDAGVSYRHQDGRLHASFRWGIR
jgi:two-component sensor histidine kinase